MGASWNDLASLSKTYLYRLLQLQSAILNRVSMHHFISRQCSATSENTCERRWLYFPLGTPLSGHVDLWSAVDGTLGLATFPKKNYFFGDISWPTVWPDLSTYDFLVRRYLKKCGFRHPYRYSCPSTSGRLTLSIIYRHLLAALCELFKTRLADLHNLKLRIP